MSLKTKSGTQKDFWLLEEEIIYPIFQIIKWILNRQDYTPASPYIEQICQIYILHYTTSKRGRGGSKYRLICKLWRPFTSLWMPQFFKRIPILRLPVWFSSTKLLKRMGYPFSSRELLQKWVQVCSCLRLACKHASANFNLLHNLAPSFAIFSQQLTWIISQQLT